MPFSITRFHGPHRWLSNFYPCEVVLDHVTYPSVENAYQAAKTLDHFARIPFERMTAGQSKRAGRLLEKRPDWADVKLEVMLDLNRQKFQQEPFRMQLIETGSDHLEEGNHWGDTFWGTCRGKGENHLGKILMRIRYELIATS